MVRDSTPRGKMSIDALLAALQDPTKSDGTLLIGVKEPNAVRGVGLDGTRLPRHAADDAETEILGRFPGLDLLDGTLGIYQLYGPGGVRPDTVYRTFIRVQAPLDATLLMQISNDPYVDYMEPNWTSGVVSGVSASGSPAPITLLPAPTETRPWGIDSVRAPEVWAKGWRGGEINLGMVDTGVDKDPGGTCHPDFNCAKLYFYSTVDTFSANSCTDPGSPCYYEQFYHGTGVLGSAIGLENGVGSVGAAPDQSHSLYKTVVAKAHFGGIHPPWAFADAVKLVSDSTWGIRVGVTALAYCPDIVLTDTTISTLHDAFIESYANGSGMLWFAGAGNTRGSDCTFNPNDYAQVEIPGVWQEVVAVGAVSQDLTLAYYSATHTTTSVTTGVELLAPGGGDSDDGLTFPPLRVSWNRLDDDPDPFTYTKEETGTSFAAPIAAGVARLALQYHANWTASQLRDNLRAYGRDTDPEIDAPMVDAVCVIYGWQPCNGDEPAQPPPSPLSVSIAGPTSIRPTDQCTWQANVSGGVSPYNYTWRRKNAGRATTWTVVGTGSSYTSGMQGYSYFDLKLDVTDSQSGSDSDQIRVTGDGTNPCLL